MITYSSSTRHIVSRWEHERCPCCDDPLTQKVSLSMGIDICGQCADNGHCLRQGSEQRLRVAVIAAIKARHDGPVARLLPSSYLPCCRGRG